MDVDAALRLSFYQTIATLNEAHGVVLVQHVETKAVFVKKVLTVYDIQVFQHLKDHPVPGVPRLQELVESEGRLYVIEEYIAGRSLREVLDTSGPLPPADALACLQQLCGTLRPLHSLSPPIVHRDIKPSNLILTPAGQLYLVDFNAAKETSGGKARDTVLIGTAGYAAPEQYGFSPSQPTADLYALGVLLNEMLTGKLPQQELAQGPLAPVIQKCLRMEPARRYQTVDLLLRDIKGRHLLPRTTAAGVRAWLPPGLRTDKPLRWLLAILWYLLIVAMSCTAVSKDTTPTDLFLLRITLFLIFFGETLWLGNYRNVWHRLPLSGNPGKPLRVLGITLWAVVLFFAVMVLTAALSLLPW